MVCYMVVVGQRHEQERRVAECSGSANEQKHPSTSAQYAHNTQEAAAHDMLWTHGTGGAQALAATLPRHTQYTLYLYLAYTYILHIHTVHGLHIP